MRLGVWRGSEWLDVAWDAFRHAFLRLPIAANQTSAASWRYMACAAISDASSTPLGHRSIGGCLSSLARSLEPFSASHFACGGGEPSAVFGFDATWHASSSTLEFTYADEDALSDGSGRLLLSACDSVLAEVVRFCLAQSHTRAVLSFSRDPCIAGLLQLVHANSDRLAESQRTAFAEELHAVGENYIVYDPQAFDAID